MAEDPPTDKECQPELEKSEIKISLSTGVPSSRGSALALDSRVWALAPVTGGEQSLL